MSIVEDRQAVELYGRFRSRLHQSTSLPLATYDHFLPLDGRFLPMLAGPFVEAAEDRLRQLANAINLFRIHARATEAWWSIFSEVEIPTKMDILVEHLELLVPACIDAPYALRMRIIDTVCVATDFAHLALGGDRPRGIKSQHSDFHGAKRLASAWASWPAAAAAISAMGQEDFNIATQNYRNRRHHGNPPAIGFGISRYVTKTADADGRECIALGERDALDIGLLLPAIFEEHRRSLLAFECLSVLLREQGNTCVKNFEDQGAVSD